MSTLFLYNFPGSGTKLSDSREVSSERIVHFQDSCEVNFHFQIWTQMF